MNILITGGAGYIGVPLVASLLSQGHKVRVFDIGLYGFEQLLGFIHLPNFELKIGDIRNEKEFLEAISSMDAVVHLAALVGENACKINKKATVDINELSVQKLLKFCNDKKGLRIVFLSTCSNYGLANNNTLADEDSELKPLSLYAETKVAAENIILSTGKNPIVTILRLGTICGLSPRMRFDLLISDLALCAIQNREIEIYKPEAWRPFVHLKDAVNVINLVLNLPKEKVHKKVFNVVKENIKKRYLGEIVNKHFPKVPIKYTTHNPDNRDYRVSGLRLKKELGYSCLVSVEEAFLETSNAINNKFFRDPNWSGHSAIPTNNMFEILSPIFPKNKF